MATCSGVKRDKTADSSALDFTAISSIYGGVSPYPQTRLGLRMFQRNGHLAYAIAGIY